jgi:hypothetical protein
MSFSDGKAHRSCVFSTFQQSPGALLSGGPENPGLFLQSPPDSLVRRSGVPERLQNAEKAPGETPEP